MKKIQENEKKLKINMDLKILILQHQQLRQVKIYFCLFLFHCLFPLEYVFTHAVEIKFQTYLLELIKRISEVHQRNMLRERALNFDN